MIDRLCGNKQQFGYLAIRFAEIDPSQHIHLALCQASSIRLGAGPGAAGDDTAPPTTDHCANMLRNGGGSKLFKQSQPTMDGIIVPFQECYRLPIR